MEQVAVVDLGTNAMRLAIGSGTAEQYELVEYVRYPNRLSEGMFADNMLKQPAMRRTLDALLEIRAILKSYKVDKLKLISTSVLRTARNAAYFTGMAREETGFSIEILPGDEEARLIHIGAVNGIDTDGMKVFITDIGGGSTELSVGTRSDIEFAVSVESGAVRLKERFIHHDPPLPAELEAVNDAIGRDFRGILGRVRDLKPQLFVGVPGNIGTIYKTLKPENGLEIGGLKTFYAQLSTMRIDGIKTLTGLEEDKADIMLPGLMILIQIMDAIGMKGCSLSSKGLLHGMIISLFSARA